MWAVFSDAGIFMIFVTVGTQKFPFDRLIKMVDEAAASGNLKDSIYMQKGVGEYVPQNCGYVDFCSNEEFVRHIDNCRLLITHSGVGTIMKGLERKKPVIIVPRLARYGEHVDDHQLQVAGVFAANRYCMVFKEKDSILDLIDRSESYKFKEYISHREKIIEELNHFISRI